MFPEECECPVHENMKPKASCPLFTSSDKIEIAVAQFGPMVVRRVPNNQSDAIQYGSVERARRSVHNSHLPELWC